ncbi:sigma-70 family RNA polymerase sigma factor [Sphingosinicella sp. LHD-64]|uniref:RNA polymerase sigma factor n=1 Tax=Sphingosinicella sp. LHD-64 TaxID=3072139 RepID=UPI00280F59CF|nr:sigma-70 family RNA polymerase sigma factor [Sphingosinicella sp. LHD-64]MDQ8757410.1 sigma-70 family RNA polymerase sigma factor [Sphingosinicella sp. LHD-64]
MDAPDDAGGGAAPGPEDARQRLDLLYRDQAPQLRRRLVARLRSTEEASDLVQEAFARLLGARALGTLRAPEAFLNRIVRNLLIDRARQRGRSAPHLPIDVEAEIAVRPTQADGIELDQMRTRYRAAVAALPPRTREVFTLHRVEELSYKAIAQRLGISVRTVEWHVAEAIVRIGKGLDEA